MNKLPARPVNRIAEHLSFLRNVTGLPFFNTEWPPSGGAKFSVFGLPQNDALRFLMREKRMSATLLIDSIVEDF